MSILHPISALAACLPFALMTTRAAGQPIYSFGNPSADEQLYIELMNRARANPAAEGVRLAAITDPAIVNPYAQFNVDLAMMQAEFAALSPLPPLAPNAALTAAARGHSQWMLANQTQAHNQTNPANTPWNRIEAAGYVDWSTLGENVYARAKSVEYGHAGFEVDWGGNGPGGMQAGRGHRESIHSEDFKEVGVGVVYGTNGTIGPQLVTQDFGEPWDDQSFGTGVAFYDLNGNGFYDLGEGIAGLTVNVSGASYSCLTADGGGWVVPVPRKAATRTVTFSGLAMNETRSLAVPTGSNAKADLMLTYSPPTITSPADGTAGDALAFEFAAVGGATEYLWQRREITAGGTESCDTLANVTTTTNSGYSVINTSVKQEGSGSFHLVNTGIVGKQTIEFDNVFYGGVSPVLSFSSRLRTTTINQQLLLEVQEEGSTNWQIVYSQTGGSTPESSFTEKSVSLPEMAGRSFRVRFSLNFDLGSYYPTPDDSSGWFIDAVSFGGMSRLSAGEEETLIGTTGSITPSVGEYLWSVAPIISGRAFPSGMQIVTIIPAQPAPGYAIWAAAVETSHSLPVGTLANHPTGDWDNDGHPNLVEYAFGTSPVVPTVDSPRFPALLADPADLVLRYVRDSALPDITIAPIASVDLVTWLPLGDPTAPENFSDVAVATDGDLETREVRIPRSAGEQWFLKLKVTKN